MNFSNVVLNLKNKKPKGNEKVKIKRKKMDEIPATFENYRNTQKKKCMYLIIAL